MSAVDPNLPLTEVDADDDGPQIGLVELLTWLGEGKRFIGGVTLLAAAVSLAVALLLPAEFTARASMLPPASQQAGGAAGALAALGALGGLAGGLAAKTPDEMYVALLKSDSVQRALDERLGLKERWDVETYEVLRKTFPKFVRIVVEKKAGVISIEVDDRDPQFAARMANAYTEEISHLMSRLAVTEAQQRRLFFDQQLRDTKERLVKAEQHMREVQEKSGVIVLDKQAEALISAAAMVRAQIAEREVMLKVMRTSATEANPDVQRIATELRALRSELARMESSQTGNPGSVVDLPVGKLPEAAIEYVRARRELKVQEMLLEGMLRQFEIAKLDEAKEAPALQIVDAAQPPDRKSKPARAVIVLASTLLAFVLACAFVATRRWLALARAEDPQREAAWASLAQAWHWRR
jgi:capsule polysaccharide export protein KpsE/RkpR